VLQIKDGMSGEGTIRVRPLRRVEYEHLLRGGAFDDERLELLFGALVEVGDPGPIDQHALSVLASRLRSGLGHRARVQLQSPLPLSDFSVPQPDVVVTGLSGLWDGDRRRIHLIVEIAGQTAAKDRGPKQMLYGQAAIDEYWLLDLDARTLEIFRDRDAVLGTWDRSSLARAGDAVPVPGFPDVVIYVSDLLAPPRRT
jgi:Putative restriction endonuclease